MTDTERRAERLAKLEDEERREHEEREDRDA